MTEFDQNPSDFETSEHSARSTEGAVEVARRPARRRLGAAPALVFMLLALAGITYRSAISDWRWEWPSWKFAAAPADLARGAPESGSADAGARGVQEPEKAVPEAEKTAVAETPAQGPELAQAAPSKEPEAVNGKQALDDIEKEAERIRKEREELAKIKEREGEKIAQAPQAPFPVFGFNGIPARQEALIREMMAQQEERMRQMMQANRGFLAQSRRRGVGGGPNRDEFDRAFERMMQEMDAFEREAREMLLNDARIAQPPWVRRLGAIPAPPFPGLPPALEEGDEVAAGAPDIKRYEFVDQNGNVVRGFEMRWGGGR